MKKNVGIAEMKPAVETRPGDKEIEGIKPRSFWSMVWRSLYTVWLYGPTATHSIGSPRVWMNQSHHAWSMKSGAIKFATKGRKPIEL